jgi:hypothetical protein
MFLQFNGEDSFGVTFVMFKMSVFLSQAVTLWTFLSEHEPTAILQGSGLSRDGHYGVVACRAIRFEEKP